MKKNLPSGIENLGPYQVHSRREIIALLRSIMDGRQLVRMVFNGGSEAIVTTILAVEDETSTIVIDCGQDDAQNQRILNSENISFETVLDRIRILFFAVRVDGCLFDGEAAFRCAIPASMIRLQRRENYRIRTPRTDILIPLEGASGESQSITACLYDISVGGICLLDEQMQLDGTFGRMYENCSVTLSDKNVIVTNLLVRNTQEMTLPNGKKIRRIGCQFEGMSNQTMVKVQRYITRIEREQNARGMGV